MEQKSDHAQVIVNPFLIYIASALIALAVQKIIPLPFLEKTPAQAIGAILIISNLIAGLPALIGMISVQTSPNPMYLGLILVYCGVVTILQLPWSSIFLPLVIWLLTIWVIIPEEKYLEGKFGAEYLDYKSKVRR
ncbi:MAG: isoprenylcysteine carboxylmethyltransferase family protein [Anaerolineales bacterium]|nr:isoprenylcysteine carboxylmethyltransferase family protein [Anaerolineales bacterium]